MGIKSKSAANSWRLPIYALLAYLLPLALVALVQWLYLQNGIGFGRQLVLPAAAAPFPAAIGFNRTVPPPAGLALGGGGLSSP